MRWGKYQASLERSEGNREVRLNGGAESFSAVGGKSGRQIYCENGGIRKEIGKAFDHGAIQALDGPCDAGAQKSIDDKRRLFLDTELRPFRLRSG